MNLQDFFENIDREQQRVKQLPAGFRPPQTSPQLSGPYPGRNATRGYLVGEGQDPSENPMAQAVTRRIMNQHPEWLTRYGVEAVMQVIDAVTAGEEDWEEIGSSDVSAFVNMVGDRLADWAGSREEMRDRRPFAEQGVSEGSLPSYLRDESRFVKSAYKTLIKYGFIPDDEDERTAQMGSFNHVKGHMAEITWEGNIKLWIKQPNGKYTRLYLDDATEMPKVAVQLKLAPVGTERGVAEGSEKPKNTTDRYIPHPKRVGVKILNPDYIEPKKTEYTPHAKKPGVMVKKGVSEDIIDKIRAKNYSRLAKRSYDKATGALDRAMDYDFSDIKNRDEHEQEFMRQMDQAKKRETKAFMLDYLPKIANKKSMKFNEADVEESQGKRQISSADQLSIRSDKGVAETGYNPLDDERREQRRMDQERAQFKRDELEAELSGEEQRYRDIMSGTWYVIIDGRAWQRQGQPVTFRGRAAARRAGQTIKNRDPQKSVTISMQLPAVRETSAPITTAPQAHTRKTNADGVSQANWMAKARQGGARLIQAKMIDGPVIAIYPDGRRDAWQPVGESVSESVKKHHFIYEHMFEEYDREKERERWEAQRAQYVQQAYDRDEKRKEYERQKRDRESQANSHSAHGQEEFIAPHGDARSEVAMFQAGTKPAAVVNAPDVGLWSSLINSGRYVIQQLRGEDGRPSGYVIGQPGEDERVEKIHALVQNASNRGFQGDFSAYQNSNYHRWLGRLLGYPAGKIEAFIQNYFRDTPDRAQARYDESMKAIQQRLQEQLTSEDILGSVRQRLGDMIQAKAEQRARQMQRRQPPEDVLGEPIRRIEIAPGKVLEIHGNEDDGFRIYRGVRAMPTRFNTLGEAEMATRIYENHGIREAFTDQEYAQAMQDYLARGGEIIQEPTRMPRLSTRLRRAGSRHIGKGREARAGQLSGRGANVGGTGKPVVAVEQDHTDTALPEKKDPDLRRTARTGRIMQQLRARYPEAQTDLEALLYDFRSGQSQDRRDINRLDTELDTEEAQIDKLQQQLDNLRDRRSIDEAEKDACYNKVKSRYKVWPSAYASGALVQCRKQGAKNWGNKS